ncbi:MAG: Gfo/Idh/MocA family oxidoreductase [Armatimonadetes bacterium]|nr:Gfo/Idh/MocA family oxidoreductase [Armatimonadota bacterium]
MKVGVLGFAHGHVGAYLGQWRERPELDVKAVCAWDHDAARLQQSCGAHGLEPCALVDEVLAHVDAVVVSSETSFHAELCEQAAAAGKAIMLQKPMALTLSQGDRIVAAVERAGVPFTMAWQMRTDPQNIKIKELLQSGELGQVFMVRRRHALSTHTWPSFADTWHANPTYNRDIWADDASHPIDFIQWLLGVPETVTAEVHSYCDPRVPNDNGIALFGYPGGPLAEVTCSFTCPAAVSTTEVVCAKGSIQHDYGDAPSCNIPRPPDAVGLRWFSTETGQWTHSDIASPPNHGHRIAGLAEPLSEWLHGGRESICTAEEGRTSLRMMLATYVSTRQGRRVTLDDPAIAEV